MNDDKARDDPMTRHRTVAMRFTDNLTDLGTIKEHENLIRKYGFSWYGKFGLPLSNKICSEVLEETPSKVLLINSGSSERYWAYVTDISRDPPLAKFVPGYYHHLMGKVRCWLKVIRFQKAPRDIMTRCIVVSSGRILSDSSKCSLSPFFIIDLFE